MLLIAVLWMAPDPAAVHVTWDGPPGCGDADVLRERIETLLADDSRSTAPVAVAGQVEEASDGGYRLQLRTQTGGGVDHRTLQAPDCEALVEGAALVVTLAVGPTELTVPEQTGPQPTGPEPAESRSAAKRQPASPQPVAEPTPPTVGFGIGVDVGASGGVLGAVWPTVGVRGSVRWRALRVEAAAQHWLPRGYAIIDGPRSGRARARITAGHVRGCGVPRAGRFEFPICAGLLAGAVTAVGDPSLPLARTTRKPWLATSLGVGVVLPVHHRVALLLDGTMHISLIRPGFFVEGITTTLYRMPAVTADVRFGVEVRLP